MPRKYQPLWERIKITGTAKVVASPNIHTRIMKAVQKEKLNDINYKLVLDLEVKKAILKTTISPIAPNTIIFTLRLLDRDINIGDL